MVYNKVLKRVIPKEWELVNIFNASNVLYGFPFNADLFAETPTLTPVIRIRDIIEGKVSAYTTEVVNEKYRLQEKDVIIGMDGNFHMNIWHNNSSFFNQRCVRFRPLIESSVSAYQIFFSVQPYIKAKEKTIKGSTVGHLSDKDVKDLWVLEPQNITFNPRNIFDSIADHIIENKKEIIELVKQRDELLPLLMNGQINSDLSAC